MPFNKMWYYLKQKVQLFILCGFLRNAQKGIYVVQDIYFYVVQDTYWSNNTAKIKK